jgi:uncharacterized protein YllA (UPF0747 family)
MNFEQPATGILKQDDYGDSMLYYVPCECGQESCAHTLEVVARVTGVMVHIYHTQQSKWWERSRWKQLWQILTQGYIETESSLWIDEQTALNYSKVLETAITQVKEFRQNV